MSTVFPMLLSRTRSIISANRSNSKHVPAQFSSRALPNKGVTNLKVWIQLGKPISAPIYKPFDNTIRKYADAPNNAGINHTLSRKVY
jgi:hypothetical protein